MVRYVCGVCRQFTDFVAKKNTMWVTKLGQNIPDCVLLAASRGHYGELNFLFCEHSQFEGNIIDFWFYCFTMKGQ